MVTITRRGLNRATLARQMLLRREPVDVASALRRLVALQAQEAPSPYLALWARVEGFDPSTLVAAFASRSVVKANVIRMTLHAVLAGEYRVFREATEPSLRSAKLSDRFTISGLTVADADELVPELLAFVAEPRSGPECEAWLMERTGRRTRAPELVTDARANAGSWWGLRQYAPLVRAPMGGPWAFGSRTAYVAPPERPTLADQAAADAALRTVARRYLEGFGPASVTDLAQFALVQRSGARAALLAIAEDLEQLDGPAGEVLFDVLDGARPDEDTPAPPRLLPMWDSLLLAYADRTRVIPEGYRQLVARRNGDVLPSVLVDGQVVGIWRPATGERAGIEVTAFRSLPQDAWDGLATEATSLVAFLADRDPAVFSRYGHWWDKPLGTGSDVRLLAGP